MTKLSIVYSLAAVLAGGTLFAQEMPRFTGKIGAGFTAPTDTAGDRLDTGWNFGAGAGINITPNVAVLGDFRYNSFGIGTEALNNLGFPDGNASMWSLTFNPVFRVNPRGPVAPYFTVGGGLYHWNQEFTRPTTATVTVFDPYFGYFYEAAVPVEEVLSSYSLNKFGWNAGVGLEFGPWRTKMFAEVRYDMMLLGNNRYANIVPFTFGVRW